MTAKKLEKIVIFLDRKMQRGENTVYSWRQPPVSVLCQLKSASTSVVRLHARHYGDDRTGLESETGPPAWSACFGHQVPLSVRMAQCRRDLQEDRAGMVSV